MVSAARDTHSCANLTHRSSVDSEPLLHGSSIRSSFRDQPVTINKVFPVTSSPDDGDFVQQSVSDHQLRPRSVAPSDAPQPAVPPIEEKQSSSRRGFRRIFRSKLFRALVMCFEQSPPPRISYESGSTQQSTNTEKEIAAYACAEAANPSWSWVA